MKQNQKQVFTCFKCEHSLDTHPFECENCWTKFCQDCYDSDNEDGCLQCDSNNKKVQVFKDLNTNNKQSLVDIRIIQKNLIYLIGLSPSISNNKATLQKPEYLGQYGTIQKIIIITSHNFNPPSNAAYVTFSNEKEASLAILACESLHINELTIRASFGTTKFCSYFLKGQQCPKIKECVYLHSHPRDKESQILRKEDMNNNKWLQQHSQKVAIQNVQKNLFEIVSLSQKQKQSKLKTIFPCLDEIIQTLMDQNEITQQQYDEATQKVKRKTKPAEQSVQENFGEVLDRKVLDIIQNMNANQNKSRFEFTKNTQAKLEEEPVSQLQQFVSSIK